MSAYFLAAVVMLMVYANVPTALIILVTALILGGLCKFFLHNHRQAETESNNRVSDDDPSLDALPSRSVLTDHTIQSLSASQSDMSVITIMAMALFFTAIRVFDFSSGQLPGGASGGSLANTDSVITTIYWLSLVSLFVMQTLLFRLRIWLSSHSEDLNRLVGGQGADDNPWAFRPLQLSVLQYLLVAVLFSAWATSFGAIKGVLDTTGLKLTVLGAGIYLYLSYYLAKIWLSKERARYFTRESHLRLR